MKTLLIVISFILSLAVIPLLMADPIDWKNAACTIPPGDYQGRIVMCLIPTQYKDEDGNLSKDFFKKYNCVVYISDKVTNVVFDRQFYNVKSPTLLIELQGFKRQ